jgi:hypothetical protein
MEGFRVIIPFIFLISSCIMAQESIYPKATPEILMQLDKNFNGEKFNVEDLVYQKLLSKKNGSIEGVRILKEGKVLDYFAKNNTSKNWVLLGTIPQSYVEEIEKIISNRSFESEDIEKSSTGRNLVLVKYKIEQKYKYLLKNSGLIDKKSATYKINNLINKGLRNQFIEN